VNTGKNTMKIKEKYTISEATEFLGFKSRSTINKHTKMNSNNALSFEIDNHGNKVISILELERVFPDKYKQALRIQANTRNTLYEIQQNAQPNTAKNTQNTTKDTAFLELKIQMLQSQIEYEQTERERERQEVQERIKLLEAIVSDLKQDKETYRNQIKAITDQRPQQATEPVKTVRKKILGIF
jgi:DNA gyrase/topoisomerase IV subunit A